MASAVSPLMHSLAPAALINYRTERYDGGGFSVSLDSFAPEDMSLIIQLYNAVKRVYDLWLYMKDAPNYELLRNQLINNFSSPQVLVSMRAIGTATYAAGQDQPLLRKIVHDVRSGALTALVGISSLLKKDIPFTDKELENAVLLARDHAKLMRNAITDLDADVRAADESLKVHLIDDFVDKWQEASITVAGKSVTVRVESTFEGSITNRCLETSAIDRILYNYINNAARFTSNNQVGLTIFPISPETVRWVVTNEISQDQAAWLAEETDGDLSRLFRGGLTRGGHGIGLTGCTDFVAAGFGIKPEEALTERYLGARLHDQIYYAWFHWPTYTMTSQDKVCAC